MGKRGKMLNLGGGRFVFAERVIGGFDCNGPEGDHMLTKENSHVLTVHRCLKP